MTPEDLVTVVIPARNEEQSIGACLDSVLTQDYRTLQVVVVDGGSTDQTAELVRARAAADERVELLSNPVPNISSSLNLAVAHARGRWLVRVDAHSTVGADYIALAVERLAEGAWGGVGGRKDGVGITPAGRAIAVAMGSKLGVGNSTYHFGTTVQEVDHLPFGAYPLHVVRSVGGWDEEVLANEDFEFDLRLRERGLRLLFDPRMRIAWHCRQSIPALFGQYHRYGRGKVSVARRHPTSMRLRHVAPPAFVVYLAAGMLLSARRPSRFAAMVAPYALAVAAESVRAGRQLLSPAERAWLPAAFLAMHIGWGTGFWRGVVESRGQGMASFGSPMP